MYIGKKTRFIISFCLVLLIAGLSAGVLAVANASKPVSPSLTAVPFERSFIDRIDLRLNATQFVFMIDEGGKYKLQFTFGAKKTEPDFFARLDDFYISGLQYSEMTVTAGAENGNTVAIPGAELPSDYDGNTQELRWTVEILFETPQTLSVEPVLHLAYTSGTKYELSESYRLEIPMLVKVCDLSPLPQVMEEAEAYFTLGIYTDESLAILRSKLNEIEYALRSPQNFNDEQKVIWLQEIADCISALMPL